MKNPNQDLAVFVEKCRSADVKATPQRIEVLRELTATDEHPDAETIYERVRERLPTISLDTVYRTLRLFEEKGVISRVGAARDRARFDAEVAQHHHFVCTECGRIRDFQSEQLDSLLPPREAIELGAVQRVHVEVVGRCSDCQRQGR